MPARLSAFVLLILASSGFALDPAEVVVVFNSAVPASRDVAEHYRAKRNVPRENLIGLPLTDREDITRADYDAKLAGPLREKLADRKDTVKVVLTVYGVPLRVGPQLPTEADKTKLAGLNADLAETKATLTELEKADPKDVAKTTVAKLAVDRLTRTIQALSRRESKAAVDSELMLLWAPPYPLNRWAINPLYFQQSDALRRSRPPVLMTSRLDGPTPAIAKRLVDDAVAVEAVGLKGKVYMDARGIKFDKATGKNATGYDGYDESFRETAALLKAGGMDVTLDDKGPVFASGTCPDAALYAGWYSHAKYVNSCAFVKGAVAWHLASSEATTLRDDQSKVWCPNLLKAGVAATIGPVGEPYTIGFPKPAEFFGFLATGKYTLVECYAKTQLFASWMGVLVGDPLYNPFAKNPIVDEKDVVPSPTR